MDKQLKEIVEQELSRKDFLKLIAGGAVVFFGVHNLISYMQHFNKPIAAKSAETTHGFGSRKFGA